MLVNFPDTQYTYVREVLKRELEVLNHLQSMGETEFDEEVKVLEATIKTMENANGS